MSGYHDSALASASSRARNAAREREAVERIREAAGIAAAPVRSRIGTPAELAALKAKADRHRPTR